MIDKPSPDAKCSTCNHIFKEHYERFDDTAGCSHTTTHYYPNPDYRQGEICGYPELDSTSTCTCKGFTITHTTTYKFRG